MNTTAALKLRNEVLACMPGHNFVKNFVSDIRMVLGVGIVFKQTLIFDSRDPSGQYHSQVVLLWG